MYSTTCHVSSGSIKGIVLAYFKGIQDVGVFVSTVFSILIFFGQNIVYQSYNGGVWGPPKRACTEKSKLNMI